MIKNTPPYGYSAPSIGKIKMTLCFTEIKQVNEGGTIDELGGKGVNLLRLSEGGFRVPSGFIIPASVFDSFSSSNELFGGICDTGDDISASCDVISKRIDDAPLDNEVINAIKEQLDKIHSDTVIHPLVAVRSSGVNEDLDEASFAGMNETVLNVVCDVIPVCEAVKECWKSLFSKRSVLYRRQHGFPAFSVSMAVVIQVMIPSDASGVVFTADAQSGSRGLMVVNAVQGMGEALVSGQVNTDTWFIRKTCLDREQEIVERNISYQSFKLCSNYPNPGTTKVELSKENGESPSLSDFCVLQVASVACDIEKYFGVPMDIEFTYYKNELYIVQARPITNLGEIPSRIFFLPLSLIDLNPLHPDFNKRWGVWFNFNNFQMIDCPLTPSTISMIRWFMWCSKKYTCSIDGYLYMNFAGVCDCAIRDIGLTLLMKGMDLECYRIIMDGYKNDYPHYINTVDHDAFPAIWDKLLSYVAKGFAYYMLTFASVERVIHDTLAIFERVDQRAERLHKYVTEAGEDVSITEIMMNNHDVYTDIYDKSLSLNFYTIVSMMIITSILERYGLSESEVQSLWCFNEESIATKWSQASSNASRCLRALFSIDPTLAKKIEEICANGDDIQASSLLESLRNDPSPESNAFIEAWDQLMTEFGHRGNVEFDLASPRYQERPSTLLSIVYHIDPSNYKSIDENLKERDQATEAILQKLTWYHRWIVQRNLPYARVFPTYREWSKQGFIRVTTEFRRALLFVGAKLVRLGLLEKVEDVFYLEMEDIMDWEQQKCDGSAFKELVTHRRAVYDASPSHPHARIILTPEVMMRDVSSELKEELKHVPDNMLVGVAACSGIVEGNVVVVTNPNTVINKGDILVAHATEPSWTPLFVSASAAILEVGGPLTHGSVIARELAIPCVVGVKDLMTRLKTGMRVRVDGTKGTVEILNVSYNV